VTTRNRASSAVNLKLISVLGDIPFIGEVFFSMIGWYTPPGNLAVTAWFCMEHADCTPAVEKITGGDTAVSMCTFSVTGVRSRMLVEWWTYLT